MFKRSLVVLAISILLVTPAAARTLDVPRPYATIQAAIDVASDGDRIVVWPGIYREQLDFRGKTLALTARQGWQSTRIAPPGVVNDLPDQRELSTVDGKRMAGPTRPGVLISLPPGSGPSTVIEGFHLDGEGTNEGIHCRGSDVTISGCVVENCIGSYDGGGMWFEHCAPTVERCVLRHNRTPISGGGIFIRLGVGFGQPRFVDNEIHDNVAGNGGGIVCIEGEGALIERNRIWDNHVDPPRTEAWGAVTIRADNCLVRNNTISFNDGGITVIGSKDVDLRNNIVSGNLKGGLIVNDYWGHTETLTHDYNDVWDNAGGNYLAVVPAVHEISLDPRFRGPLLERGPNQLALRHDSPCIDAGDPDPAYADPDGSRNDLGALPFHRVHPPKPLAMLGGKGLLVRNWPNPFNPSTTISYSLPEPGRVRLAIHDVRGARVATLVDADLPSGEKSAEWSGRDDRGAPVPSGIYFVRLQTSSGMRVMTITLAK